ncbi:hypothetical protein GIB67_027092 [Kingdonia uniflora]|uniref:CCHC-type domain-containing protein n=1 Tax=Kingdonia uniflora TaxID=39325 RepID=A0A7J7P1R0_9MAGN|nr:hypothetical protein GIB67_027092 [Kingdonia uniflora]
MAATKLKESSFLHILPTWLDPKFVIHVQTHRCGDKGLVYVKIEVQVKCHALYPFDNTSYISLKKVFGGISRRAVERTEENLVGDQERLLREQKSDSCREALVRREIILRLGYQVWQNVNYKSRPHDRVKSYGKQTNSSTHPHNDSNQDLNKVECYRCYKYGHYAHSCPTKSSNSNHKAVNIKVSWDDDNDEFDDHPQEYKNGNYCAFPSIINSSNNYSDTFELENFIEGQSDYESDNSEEPKIEELYSQLISQLEKLKKEKDALIVKLDMCEKVYYCGEI